MNVLFLWDSLTGNEIKSVSTSRLKILLIVLFIIVAPVQNTPYMDVKQHSIGLQDSTKTFVGTTVLTVWRGK